MVQLAVIQKGSGWTVLRDGRPIADEMSRSNAIVLADKLAFEFEGSDRVELLVQDYAGELQARYSGPAA